MGRLWRKTPPEGLRPAPSAAASTTRYEESVFWSRLYYQREVNDDSVVLPLDDEVSIDLHREVSVVNLENLEVVEADGNV